MNIHVAYHFKSSEVSGFGDCTIEGAGSGPRNAADIKEIKNHIKAKLSEDGLKDAAVVILCWTEMR